MKENSIEEALGKLSTSKKIKMYDLLRTFKKEGSENFVTTRKKYIDVILSDYKRVLKENEELKQEKINNYRMITLAQNEALGYMQGYEDGKKLKTSAIASIVENQQYYIIREQIEKYEQNIKKLQTENKELKKFITEGITIEPHSTYENYQLNFLRKNFISKQKVKDKMQKDIKTNEHTILGGRRNGKTLEYGKRLGRIEMCKELLESEE